MGGFFEGDDFKDAEFKALIPKYYPPKYQKYIAEETDLLKTKLSGAGRVLEAGVGVGRIIPELAPVVKEFVGVDNAELMLKQSQEVAKNFPNVKIVKADLENLSKIFPPNHFDFTLCLWNTLGNVDDEVAVLKELARVTSKSIFVTVYLKGTLDDRKNWYKQVGITISKVDEKNEIFYSETGLRSKSYALADVGELANKSGLGIKESKILAGVILWLELEKT
ncbi:MAG: class I SAM-dependent methyltransferase [Candidatus Micrarchaeota archaeon]